MVCCSTKRGSGLAKALAGGAADALEGFLEETDQLAESHRFPEGFRFGRKKLYKDRL
jgi:hypothetical protein